MQVSLDEAWAYMGKWFTALIVNYGISNTIVEVDISNTKVTACCWPNVRPPSPTPTPIARLTNHYHHGMLLSNEQLRTISIGEAQ